MPEIMKPEDLLGRSEPLVIDVSKWQGTINWAAVAQFRPRVHGAVARATLGNYFTDPTYAYNRDNCREQGIAFGAYMVVNPKTGTGREQAEHFLQVSNPADWNLAPWVDVELISDVSPAQYSKIVFDCCEKLYEETKRTPVIYSRATFIDTYITGTRDIPGYYNSFHWALAQYLSSGQEHMGPVKLPKGVSAGNVLFHQTSCTGPGRAMGMSSVAVDTDRWLKSLEAFYEYAGMIAPVEEQQETELSVLQDIRDLLQTLVSAAPNG